MLSRLWTIPVRASPLNRASSGLPGKSRCGTYEVFEDRAANSGRTIILKIVLLKALGKSPAPDAIVTLHGGPGAAATELVGLAYGGILETSRQDHDLVFVDQRGTGGSGALWRRVGIAKIPPYPRSSAKGAKQG